MLLQWRSESDSHSVMSDSVLPHGLYSSWNSPGQNTGVSSLSLPQGNFPTQGLNPGLLHWRWILYQQSHKEILVQFLGQEDTLVEGMANPLHYSDRENPVDRGAWQTTVHGVAKSRTWLNNKLARRAHTHTHTHTCSSKLCCSRVNCTVFKFFISFYRIFLKIMFDWRTIDLQYCESAISIHVFLPSEPLSLHPSLLPTPLGHHRTPADTWKSFISLATKPHPKSL